MADHSKLIGYARVSTEEQVLDVQIEALKQAGVHPEDIFVDKMSGVSERREGFRNCMFRLRQGDTLIVWKLDRIARSVMGLIKITEDLMNRGIDLKVVTEPYDTSTALGRAFFDIAATFAQLERDLIAERTKAALDLKKKRGERMGRPPKITQEIWDFAIAQRARGISYPKISDRAKNEMGYKGQKNAFYTYKDMIDAGDPYPWAQASPDADEEPDWAET